MREPVAPPLFQPAAPSATVDCLLATLKQHRRLLKMVQATMFQPREGHCKIPVISSCTSDAKFNDIGTSRLTPGSALTILARLARPRGSGANFSKRDFCRQLAFHHPCKLAPGDCNLQPPLSFDRTGRGRSIPHCIEGFRSRVNNGSTHGRNHSAELLRAGSRLQSGKIPSGHRAKMMALGCPFSHSLGHRVPISKSGLTSPRPPLPAHSRMARIPGVRDVRHRPAACLSAGSE